MREKLTKKRGLLSTFLTEYTAIVLFILVALIALATKLGRAILFISVLLQIVLVIAGITIIKHALISQKFLKFQHNFLAEYEKAVKNKKKLNRLMKTTELPNGEPFEYPTLQEFLSVFAVGYYEFIGVETENDRLRFLCQGSHLELSEETEAYLALHFGVSWVDFETIFTAVTVKGEWVGVGGFLGEKEQETVSEED